MYPLRYRCFWPDIRKNAFCCWRLKKVNKKSNFLIMTSALKLNLLQPLRCFFFCVLFVLRDLQVTFQSSNNTNSSAWYSSFVKSILGTRLRIYNSLAAQKAANTLFFFLWAFHFYQNMKKGGRQTIYHSLLTTSTTFQVQQQESKSPTAQRPALSKSPHTHETTPRWK